MVSVLREDHRGDPEISSKSRTLQSRTRRDSVQEDAVAVMEVIPRAEGLVAHICRYLVVGI